MGYKIQFEDITNVQREISNSMAIWNNSINKLLKAIKTFSDDSSLKGETMDSIKVYLMAALGILSSMLGFNDSMLNLMIALYIAQDSFGTACNVTGDGAIAVFMDAITHGKQERESI